MNNTIFDDVFRTMIENMPDYLEADVVFPDENTYVYSIPTIKMSDYTKDSIFEKNLLMLLPFYIMRYEKKGHDLNNNPELFQILLNEYEEIRINLERELTETGRSELYTDLTKLIVKIADYIFRKEEDVRKGIGEIMGGKVLELESERLKTEGMIAGAIKTCKKFKLDQEASVKNIMEEFSLSEEDASNYVKKYL